MAEAVCRGVLIDVKYKFVVVRVHYSLTLIVLFVFIYCISFSHPATMFQ